MVAVTYGAARAVAGARKKSKAPGAFARFMTALMDARLRQAEREIFMHRHLVQDWDRFGLPAPKKISRRR